MTLKMMELSGTWPGRMLKSLFRKLIFLKSWILNIHQKPMWDWKVRMKPFPALTEYQILLDMDIPENDCPELSEKTANAIDDSSLQELFVSTQMNNLDLCVRSGLKWVSHQILLHLRKCWASRHVFQRDETSLEAAFIIVLSKFPHYWVHTTQCSHGNGKTEFKTGYQKCKLVFEKLWNALTKNIRMMYVL